VVEEEVEHQVTVVVVELVVIENLQEPLQVVILFLL
jgi:hypothetical protein